MPTWHVNSVVIEADQDTFDALLAEAASIDGEGAPIVQGAEIIIRTAHEPAVRWAQTASARHPGATVTIGWVSGVESDIGWRRYRVGETIAAEDLELLSWDTPHEWAVKGYEMFARGGIRYLLDDCDDRDMYPDA